MKTRWMLMVLGVMVWTVASLAADATADQGKGARESFISLTREDVVQRLGPIRGMVNFEHREILQFDRGLVELRDGKVVRADVLSPEELTARRAQEKSDWELARQRAIQQAARRKADGEALRNRLKTDADFALKPASERAAAWRELGNRYPEAMDAEYQAILAAADAEASRQAMEQRVSQLEYLAWEANRRAQNAEAEARRARVAPVVGYDPFTGRYTFNPRYGVVPNGWSSQGFGTSMDFGGNIRTRQGSFLIKGRTGSYLDNFKFDGGM